MLPLKLTDAVRTWEMLQSWTQINIQKIDESGVSSPANAIYMTTTEHASFGRYSIYLDKEAVSHLRDDPFPPMAMFPSTLILLTGTRSE
ncbi:hypothetical protein SERLA73DRAFT_178312 [Serpula lacrymans var. lacrymans S7.3]|uniref:Uncharacterized protein n=1 Tax=Serpula lacrymans var. lacrymans (strain S7.3) TaxID=936435 RepID=F8PRA3_SERL3|nr:hypothetical protein SERLA73DRAFT_178312 [Serpula lacrymans var. lacrymans S7.3]